MHSDLCPLTVLWIFWLVGTCLCLFCSTSIPIKMLALRYLPRLLYRLDGWCLVLYHNWEINESCACGLGTCVSASSCSSYVRKRTQTRQRPTHCSISCTATECLSRSELEGASDRKRHVGEVVPIGGAGKCFCGQLETLLPSLRGSWPAVVAECFVTFVVDCEASDWYLGRRSGATGVVRRGHQVRSTLRLDAT